MRRRKSSRGRKKKQTERREIDRWRDGEKMQSEPVYVERGWRRVEESPVPNATHT